MKIKVLIAATATVALCANVAAQSLNESGGAYTGAMPVGILANPLLRDVLQAAQFGAGSVCIGNDAEICMPSVSTIELSSIMQSGFGEEWGSYGITAFGTGALASTAVCGTIASDEATRVAARHVGVGCSTTNPGAAFSTIAGTLDLTQASTQTCLSQVEGAAAGGIGFAIYTTPGAHNFVKLDGTAPTLAQFEAGNYAMFGDVHGGTILGQVDAAALPPMHASAGNFSLSNECAAGRLRKSGVTLSGDLVN